MFPYDRVTRTWMSSSQQPLRRAPLTHHVLELDDGHQVGVSVGGKGVPLVFMHALALSRRAYLDMLSRVAGLGFRVIALDAPGHGDTHNLPRGSDGLADRVDLTLRTLDALGIQQAVFAGHSMGGRTAIHLASEAPQRVLAVVLLNAAAGAAFDTSVAAMTRTPHAAVRTLIRMAVDTHQDPFRVNGIAGASRYIGTLASITFGNARQPTGVPAAALSIARSGDYTARLHSMRDFGIPTIVVHGERDMIVPFEAALDMADDADATLYKVPGAYHSWMIADPRHGADALRQLLNAELGEALSDAADAVGISDWRDATAWDEALIEADAPIRRFDDHEVHRFCAEKPAHIKMERLRSGASSALSPYSKTAS